jgi:peptide deformylase
MAIRKILLLGNPLLYRKCAQVRRSELKKVIAVGRDLRDTRAAFRARYGWGRAIAAPQIGVMKRIIYVEADKPWLIINPAVTARSQKTMKIWDDCMSFPDLLVRVKRHVSFTLTYRDDKWIAHTLKIEEDLSELLQHELDHLDGVLAVSRAIDGTSFCLQSKHRS